MLGTVPRRTASVIRLLVPLGELEENHFLAVIVDIVEYAVGSNSQAILGSEL